MQTLTYICVKKWSGACPHTTGECINVHEGMVSWDCMHMNQRSDLLREYDASIPPSPSIEGALPGSR